MLVNKRIISIVKILNNEERYFTSQELSSTLDVSSKTIIREIKKFGDNEQSQDTGFTIDSRKGLGYKIIISDEKKFNSFKEIYFNSHKISTLDYKHQREEEIIQLLLNQDDYITALDMSEKLYISERTITSSLKDVKKILENYGVKFISKPSKGVKVKGSELNIRLCLSKFNHIENNVNRNVSNNVNANNDYIKEVLLEIFTKYDIKMSKQNFNHILTHITISISRMNAGHRILFDAKEIEQLSNKEEYQIATKIIEKIIERVSISDIQGEIAYLAIQLLGKRSLVEDIENYQLSDEVRVILDFIFNEIYEQLNIDLKADDEVFNYLAMHFEPMFTRLQYGIKLTNPLLEEIKTRQATSFEMGLIAKRVILDSYRYELDDNEVSYLAMYFSLALDKLKLTQKPRKVLIVCGLGVCSSRILRYRLRQQYGKYIEEIDTVQVYELNNKDMSLYDCIISTINIDSSQISQPVIYIDDFLETINNTALDNYFFNQENVCFNINLYMPKQFFFHAKSMRNKEAAIDFILENLSQYMKIPTELKQNILEREQLSSTAYGNNVAMPHPIKMCTKDTFISILVLDKAVGWGKRKVKYIFLLSPSKQNPRDLEIINDMLASFILDTELFNLFVMNPTYKTLIEIFKMIKNL